MKIVYRVVVEATHYDESGDLHHVETLFEAGSPDAARLYSFVPEQVELALAGEGDEPEQDAGDEPEATAGGTMDPFPVKPGDPKPKRTRRTKAQIAADKLAAEHATVPAEAPPAPSTPEQAPAVAVTATLEPVQPVPAAVEPEVPYNPFL